jgi:hypothetical protein
MVAMVAVMALVVAAVVPRVTEPTAALVDQALLVLSSSFLTRFMSQNYAIVKGGYIINTIVWDGVGTWPLGPGEQIMLESEARDLGYDWEPEPEPVPQSISPRQMRLWLLSQDAGDGKTMFTKAIEHINAPADTIERQSQQITWDYATEIRRSDPLTSAIGALLGLSSAQIDQAFREAALL